MYARSDIVLLDDSLAAVDAIVADALFDSFRNSKYLKNRLLVLVTNQVSRVAHVDKIIVIADDGKMQAFGTYEELIESGIDFYSFEKKNEVIADEEKQEEQEKQDADVLDVMKDNQTVLQTDNDLKKIFAQPSMKLPKRGPAEVDNKEKSEMEKRKIEFARATSTKEIQKEAEQLFSDEKRELTGRTLFMLKNFAKKMGNCLFFFVCFFNIGYVVLPSIGNIILSYLTNAVLGCGFTNTSCQQTEEYFYLSIYTIIMGLTLLFCCIGAILLAVILYQSINNIHG